MKKSLFNEYFSFSVSEKRSILIVSILIIITVIASYLIKHIPKKSEEFSEKQLSEIYELAAKLSETDKIAKNADNSIHKKSLSLFQFDPNTATIKDFEKLGFSERQINTIKNFLKAGGKFYDKQDFKKIYNISNEEYCIYEPYIKIERSSDFSEVEDVMPNLIKETTSADGSENELIQIEVNSADIYELTLLKGVGEVYANRIIKFRELLGGFYKKEQLLEVYGFNDTIFQQLQPQIEIDTSMIKTIDLNNASYKDLIKHPYLDSYNTKAILNYREFKKRDISKADLLKDNILTKDLYHNVSPYLKP